LLSLISNMRQVISILLSVWLAIPAMATPFPVGPFAPLGQNQVWVNPSSNPLENGLNLTNAILKATMPATVIALPGDYDVGTNQIELARDGLTLILMPGTELSFNRASDAVARPIFTDVGAASTFNLMAWGSDIIVSNDSSTLFNPTRPASRWTLLGKKLQRTSTTASFAVIRHQDGHFDWHVSQLITNSGYDGYWGNPQGSTDFKCIGYAHRIDVTGGSGTSTPIELGAGMLPYGRGVITVGTARGHDFIIGSNWVVKAGSVQVGVLSGAPGDTRNPDPGILEADEIRPQVSGGDFFVDAIPGQAPIQINGANIVSGPTAQALFKVQEWDDIPSWGQPAHLILKGCSATSSGTYLIQDTVGTDNSIRAKVTIIGGISANKPASGNVDVRGTIDLTNGVVIVPAGASTNRMNYGGNIFAVASDVGTIANTSETDLAVTNIAGFTLTNNLDAVEFWAAGTYGATANNKTIRVKLGATTLLDTGVRAINGGDWAIDGKIIRTGASAQRATIRFLAPAFTTNEYTTATEILGNNLLLKITGQNGTAAANDIIFTGWKGRLEPATTVP
jgi:hypothetical protein